MGRPQKPGKDGVGTLDLLILSRLAKGSMHGYGIAEFINQVSEALHVEEGSLYPALYRLENKGWLKSEWKTGEGGREGKYYSLTKAGERRLSTETSGWKRLCDAIALVLETSE